MGKMSREKGKRYEREIASFLRSHGYDCRRGQQYCGASGDADVVGLSGIHIECKHVEKMSLYDWMDQSVRDAKKEELPAVFHRKNNSVQDERARRATENYHQYRPRRDTSGDLFPRTGGQSQDHQSFHG